MRMQQKLVLSLVDGTEVMLFVWKQEHDANLSGGL